MFKTTCSAHHEQELVRSGYWSSCELESHSRRGVLDTTLFDQISQ